MTPAEWKQVQEALNDFWHRAVLEIDGYKISLQLVRVSTYKNAIAIYVNNRFEGKWLITECEERRRFLPKKVKPLYSKAKVEALRKELKVSKSVVEKHNPSFEYYSTHWTSFAALKKHLLANNIEISLTTIQGA